MKRSHYSLAGKFLLLFFLLCSSLALVAQDSDFIVKDLKAEDIPDDDGAGIQVSWRPLPKEAKIIEYRIYRGVSPDTLFYAGKIPVNAKIGVISEFMYFYDKDYQPFVDINSPGKLKKEEQQDANSPLYQEVPRDLNVTGPLLSQYDILGIIAKNEFFYKAQKIELEPDAVDLEEGETPEKEVLAGLKIHQIRLYKQLSVDKTYYYTVLAVSQSRKYYPYAPIVSAAPRNNSPEKPGELFSVLVSDIDRLQFEWSNPLLDSDIIFHSVYMLPKDKKDDFIAYTKQQKQIEADNLAKTENPDAVVEEITDRLQNPATLLFRRQAALPYTTVNRVALNIKDGKIIEHPEADLLSEQYNTDLEIDTKTLNDYYFVFSLFDFTGMESFSDVSELKTITSAELPKIPEFTVTDTPDDKGDYNAVFWGAPVAYITQTSFANEAKTKLLVNYSIMENKDFEVQNVYFKVFDKKGNLIKEIDEYYQDDKIIVKAPENTDMLAGLDFEISMKVKSKSGKALPADYVFKQEITFNEATRSLAPGKLFLGDEEINQFSYIFYKRPYSSGKFRVGRKVGGYQRGLNDGIPYSEDVYKGVSQYDAEKGLVLVSASQSVTLDRENNVSISTSVFKSEADKMIKGYEEDLAEYKAQLDTIDASKKERVQAQIDQLNVKLNFAATVESQKIANNKDRVKYLTKIWHDDKRSFEYKIVKTDGEGVFSETDVYRNEAGNSFMLPVSNWFYTDKIGMLIATILFGALVFIMIRKARRGDDLYLRPIAGIQEIDNAIGRATEMGRPILFVPGLSGISDVATLAGLAILGRVAKKAAEYDTKILVPVRDYIVLPIAQEIVKEAHYEAGRPDSYDKGSVFFITTSQFAFVAGVNGVMIRERTSTNFYMGMFWAESLIMTETGNATGAIQISGTDAVTQIPFFITTCDYTLIGEELYGAAAYLAREPLMMGTLKAQDYFKFLILFFMILGTILSTSHVTFLINAFPEK